MSFFLKVILYSLSKLTWDQTRSFNHDIIIKLGLKIWAREIKIITFLDFSFIDDVIHAW